ncbi:unnamed protein product [Paramecium sonneborni]|uniref:Uncharacterized protein n=1 Tax=Paramecium sonneborni TaxID=65129 RepID=A0A8S1RET3_9CILI|nr:unnamed protein product [Paramecium sonneborni]
MDFIIECQRKYGSANVWRYCTDVFDYLIISAVIQNRVFWLEDYLQIVSKSMMQQHLKGKIIRQKARSIT